MSDPIGVAERARTVVMHELVGLGYSVERDSSRGSGRITVTGRSGRFEVYVSGANGWGYPMWTERRLRPSPLRFAVVVRFPDRNAEPELYLIPTLDWLSPEVPLVNPQYEAMKSEPEYGVRLTSTNYDALQRYRWARRVQDLPS
jgi:hypothetical protein